STLQFVPAQSKAEAVSRMYVLGRRPIEPLGPGSKEKKSSIVALGHAVGLDLTDLSGKVACSEAIAQHVGVQWDGYCYSRGDTITLIGLNRLLAGATRYLDDGATTHPPSAGGRAGPRSEEHTSELQSRFDLVCRLLLEKKNSK